MTDMPDEQPTPELPEGVEHLVIPDPTQPWTEETLIAYYEEHPEYRPPAPAPPENDAYA